MPVQGIAHRRPKFPAHRQSLDRPADGQQDRSGDPDGFVGREAPDGNRWDPHCDDAEHQGQLTGSCVRHVAKEDGPERAGDEADGEHPPEGQALLSQHVRLKHENCG